MKKIRMKGKTVDEAKKAALEVLGGEEEKAKITVIAQGKSGMLGMIGGEDAEVEVVLKEGIAEDARHMLQEILDKMAFLAIAEAKEEGEGSVLSIKGEDLGRIIGKEGGTLRALEILVGSMMSRVYDERVRISIDAGGYREKREKALMRLASEVAEEVEKTGQEKALPALDARDRRTIHMHIKENPKVTSYSQGEGKDRRLIIAPRR